MMEQIFAEIILPILATAITALAGYIGLQIKALYKKHIDDKTKESVVRTVVKAVKQLYKDLNGEEKLAKAIENITDMLNEKGIAISELEIRMLIESAVEELKESATE
jgi:LL-H family phage holin